MAELPEPIPAATLVLMRAGSPPELLMMERASTMAFAAGALVFPGGRIEPGDHDAAGAFPDMADAAARIAAVRETIEETGVAAGLSPAPDAATASALREGLSGGAPFAALIEDAGLELDLGALTPFARWCPNFRETRRFDTLFFLAEAPAGLPIHSADDAESVRTFWASAADVLADVEAGRAHVIFPTRRNLERLARFASIEEARADAAAHPVRRITPWVEERDGQPHVCIPADAGYPVTSEPLETARRR
ncbi:MAG TPA: NUDIX domain-containing protein [Allosphingosinicella sp.]|jgi:8-oxo-dGTP pyrophosphatase MutT (NUDIX family)